MRNLLKLFSVFATALVITACGGGGGPGSTPQPQQGTASQYFTKTTVGNTWTYIVTHINTPTGKPSLTSTVMDVKTITSSTGGVVTYSDTETSNGVTALPVVNTMQIDATGALIETSSNGSKRKMLPASFSVGTAWVSEPGDPTVGWGGVNATIAAFNVTRTGPAGTFTDCLQINYTWAYSSGGLVGTGKSTAYISLTVRELVEEAESYSYTGSVNGVDYGSTGAFNIELQRYTVN